MNAYVHQHKNTPSVTQLGKHKQRLLADRHWIPNQDTQSHGVTPSKSISVLHRCANTCLVMVVKQPYLQILTLLLSLVLERSSLFPPHLLCGYNYSIRCFSERAVITASRAFH